MTIDVFAVIADQTRRRILVAVKDSPRPVNDIVTELGVSQPTVSKHLKVLREAGLVSMRAAGQRRLYSIDSEPLDEVVSWAASLGCAPEPAAAGAVPADPEAATAPESATVPEAVAGVPEPRDASGPVDDAVPEHPQREVTFPSTAAEAPAPLATPAPPAATVNESAPVEDDAGPSDPAPSSRHARVVFQPLAPLSSRRGADAAPPAEESAEARPAAPTVSESGAPVAEDAPAASDGGVPDAPADELSPEKPEDAPSAGEPAEEPAAAAEGDEAAAEAPEPSRGGLDEGPRDLPEEAPAQVETESESEPEPAPESAPAPETESESESESEPESTTGTGAEPEALPAEAVEASDGPASSHDSPSAEPGREQPAVDALARPQRDAGHVAESKPTGFLANLFGKRRAR